MPPLKRSLLIFAALCAASLTSAQAAQPSVDPEFAADVVDRYANHIYYGSGAIGMALVVLEKLCKQHGVLAARDADRDVVAG